VERVAQSDSSVKEASVALLNIRYLSSYLFLYLCSLTVRFCAVPAVSVKLHRVPQDRAPKQELHEPSQETGS
jgi:hypothetical protein